MAFTALEKVALVFLSIFGLYIIRKLFVFIYENLIGPNVNKVDYKAQGQWALVTGSTDGVGKAYARALAARGCDIILVSRNKAKLQDVAGEIEKEFNVQTRLVEADFTETEDVYARIEKEIAGLEIGTLVNNVGISYPHPDYFLNLVDREMTYERIIKANVIAVTRMCSLVMPAMAERRRGVVINVSSTACLIPSPLLAVYAASKAYVDKLSADLHAEYASSGLTVQCVLPGYVVTNMSKLRQSTWMAPTPRTYVEAALSTVGTKARTTGYAPHSLLVAVVGALSALSERLSVWVITRTMLNLRRRALKKYDKSD